MKYPLFENKRKIRTVFSDFSGGINTTLDPMLTEQNEYSVGENVFPESGAVKSRFAFHSSSDGIVANAVFSPECSEVFSTDIRNLKDIVKAVGSVSDTEDGFLISVGFLKNDGSILPTSVNITAETSSGRVQKPTKILLYETEKGKYSHVFLLVPVKITDGVSTETKKVYIYEYSRMQSRWYPAGKEDFGDGLYYINGRGNLYDESYFFFAPDEPEFRMEANIFNGGMTASFNADGHSYAFMFPVNNLDTDAPVTVTYNINVDDTYSWVIPAGQSKSEESVSIGGRAVDMYFNRSTGMIQVKSGSNYYSLENGAAYNSLKVTAYKRDDEALYDFIMNMTNIFRSGGFRYFGSGREKEYRLYCVNDKEGSFVQPNGGTELGDSDKPVTAIASQNKYAFIFKSDCIYRTELSVDYLEYEYQHILPLIMKYPVPSVKGATLNPAMGCDCPKTLCLCANRLIWLNTGGNVYTIFGSNNYTEGSIYELSGKISSDLKKEDLSGAVAGVHDGYYVIFVKSRMYVMDSHAANFGYMSNYGSKRTSKGLNWYKWSMPEAAECFGTVPFGERLYMFIIKKETDGVSSIQTSTFVKSEKDYLYTPIRSGMRYLDSFSEYEIPLEAVTKAAMVDYKDGTGLYAGVKVLIKNRTKAEIYVLDDNSVKIAAFSLSGAEHLREVGFNFPVSDTSTLRIGVKCGTSPEIRKITLIY